jgi:hypothetical protein
MPASKSVPGQAIAHRRILRLALGTTLAMAVTQVIAWPMSFIAAAVTMLLLALPLPAPTPASAIKLVVALAVPAYAGLLLLPFLEHVRLAGILLVIMALFGAYYYTARGGAPVMGVFMTMGVTITITVGSVSPQLALIVINAITVGAIAGMVFVMLAFALLPDLPMPLPGRGAAEKPPAKPGPSLETARRNAFRALAVVLPLVIVFLFSASSVAYVPVMMKVSSMGQQANAQTSRAMGRAQLESTIWGGVGAIIIWQIMSIWPSLLMFCLLIALGCLVYGARIFQGPAMHPKGAMWSYALMTMIILVAPAVSDSIIGSDVSSSFYSRLLLFLGIAVYGTVAVAVFDAFWPGREESGQPQEA